MNQKSHADRMLWAQFDALEMGTGWDDLDKMCIRDSYSTITP